MAAPCSAPGPCMAQTLRPRPELSRLHCFASTAMQSQAACSWLGASPAALPSPCLERPLGRPREPCVLPVVCTARSELYCTILYCTRCRRQRPRRRAWRGTSVSASSARARSSVPTCRQHGHQSSTALGIPLAVPQLGFCASWGGAWRLWAGSQLPGASLPRGIGAPRLAYSAA